MQKTNRLSSIYLPKNRTKKSNDITYLFLFSDIYCFVNYVLLEFNGLSLDRGKCALNII